MKKTALAAIGLIMALTVAGAPPDCRHSRSPLIETAPRSRQGRAPLS
jgi:hypothetical protein